MIVKYVRERGHKGEGKDRSFTLGNTYLVLGIDFSKIDDPTYLSIMRESDGTPALLELQFFDVVDPAIPPDWELSDFYRVYSLQPKEFGGDFWDEFHDGVESAEALFANTLQKIKRFHKLA